MRLLTYDNLGDVDVGVLVAHKVDVWRGQILADEMPPGPAWLVVPLESPGGGVVHQGHAGLVAEAVGAEGAVGLGAVGAALGPVVELE